jgi:peroxidase
LTLFSGTAKFGFDIVALNIQRGREHGLPGFNNYREMCGLPKLKKFTDLISNPQVNL